MKDGRTRLAYKPENAVDLDTGVVVASEIHHADKDDTKTFYDTLNSAQNALSTVGKAPISPAKRKLLGTRGIIPAKCSRISRTALGKPESVNRKVMPFTAGTATIRPDEPYTTTDSA